MNGNLHVSEPVPLPVPVPEFVFVSVPVHVAVAVPVPVPVNLESVPCLQVPMAALYLVAWQDTDKAAVLPPVVVELCQAVRWQRYEMYKK